MESTGEVANTSVEALRPTSVMKVYQTVIGMGTVSEDINSVPKTELAT